MPPALALLGVGPGSWWVPIPVPLFLLWPFFFLALAVVGLKEAAADAVAFPHTRALWLAFWELRGLKVDFQTATGPRVFLWVV